MQGYVKEEETKTLFYMFKKPRFIIMDEDADTYLILIIHYQYKNNTKYYMSD